MVQLTTEKKKNNSLKYPVNEQHLGAKKTLHPDGIIKIDLDRKKQKHGFAY